jgi:hypothetical protein
VTTAHEGGRGAWKRDLALVAGARAIVSAAALAFGFRAVSDDDYARAAIAAAFAHAPRLDPTGTSWLPLPFWITGGAEIALGSSLTVARGVALALGLASSVLLLVAARGLASRAGGELGLARRAALLGALLATALPWSARLGVATVPELPAAALSVVGLASASDARASRRLAGALALCAATLCRYEPWPLAAGFAALCLLDAARGRGGSRPGLVVAAAVALLGPAAWIAWNAHAHGDALHFVARVAAYKQALGEGAPGLLDTLLSYPRAALMQEPEIFLALAAALYAARAARAPIVATLRAHARPLALAGLMLAALVAGSVRDAAPTHHPERALLPAMLLAALLLGDLVARAAAQADARRRLVRALAVALVAGGLVRARFLGWGAFAPREDEVAMGVAARAAAPCARVLVEVTDYGYWAVVAAIGRPEGAIVDREIDPRAPREGSSFDDAGRLRARLAGVGAGCFVARRSAVTDVVGGEPLGASGAMGLWQAR